MAEKKWITGVNYHLAETEMGNGNLGNQTSCVLNIYLYLCLSDRWDEGSELNPVLKFHALPTYLNLDFSLKVMSRT